MNKLLIILSTILVAVSFYNDRALDRSFANADEILEQIESRVSAEENGLESILEE